jgi:hypothetical protein
MTEYKDFLAFNLENDGSFNEFNITEDVLGENLSPEGVLLIVKNDMRRLFIWKGPKSPVRKRFISSKAAAEIQENVRKETGRQLKIISVDAGEEPIEFLQTFNLQSMDASERLEDLRYIRNAERERLEQEQLKQNTEKSKQKQDYWSPAMDEAKREAAKKENSLKEDTKKENSLKEEAKKEVIKEVSKSSTISIKNESKSVTSDEVATISKNAADAQSKSITMGSAHSSSKSKQTDDQIKDQSAPYSAVKTAMTSDKEKKIIEEVLKNDPPKGSSRMNIIIGQTLYAPNMRKSNILGKEIETVDWEAASDLPGGIIDLNTNNIRVFIDEKFKNIKAIEIYQTNKSNKKKEDNFDSDENKEENIEEIQKPEPKKKSARALPKIPSND